MIVLIYEIAQQQFAGSSEIVEGPVSVSLELRVAFAQIAAAGDGGGFLQVDLGLIAGVDSWIAEVADAASSISATIFRNSTAATGCRQTCLPD